MVIFLGKQVSVETKTSIRTLRPVFETSTCQKLSNPPSNTHTHKPDLAISPTMECSRSKVVIPVFTQPELFCSTVGMNENNLLLKNTTTLGDNPFIHIGNCDQTNFRAELR